MRLEPTDELLDRLILLFNQSAERHDWDAAYGASVALAEHYELRARQIREGIVSPLLRGVQSRALDASKKLTLGRRRKK